MVRSWQARYFFILKITLLCVMGISMGQLMYPYYDQHDMVEPSYRYPPYNPMMSFHHFGPHFHQFPDKTIMHDMHGPLYKSHPHPPTMPNHSMPPELAHVGSNDINPPNPADACQLQMDHGSCSDMLPRYFYDINARGCQLFTYGGCHGNANNFITMEECENACLDAYVYHDTVQKNHKIMKRQEYIPINNINPSIPADTCQLQMDHGSCTDMLPRYFYDINARECQPFTYGGCYGNANNFITMEECENACLGHISSQVSFRTYPQIMEPSDLDHDLFYRSRRPRLCYLPKKRGPCMAFMPRWYFNSRSGRCERFNYGGCMGNANNFVTQQECKRTCKPQTYYLHWG